MDVSEKPVQDRNTPHIKGYLFENHEMLLDSRTAEVAGSWDGGVRDGKLVAWEGDTLKFVYEKLCKQEAPVLLDVGANTGSYSLLPAILDGLRCYALEPAPLIYDILCENIRLNGLNESVKSFKCAVSDKPGTAVLKFPQRYSGLACLGKPLRFQEWEEIEVELSTLDQFISDQQIERVDFLKIDTEGCEKFVLRGAENLIKTHHPMILIEYSEESTRQFGYHAAEVLNLLARWGYLGNKVDHENYFCYLNPQIEKFISDVPKDKVVMFEHISQETLTDSGEPAITINREQLTLASGLAENGYRVVIKAHPEANRKIQENFAALFDYQEIVKA